MRRLCVTPCGSAKIWKRHPEAGPMPAHQVYVGTFARACQAYAQTFFDDDWVILSAKYGLLLPNDTVPGDYNVSFNQPSTEWITVSELQQQVKEKKLDTFNEIVVVAGKNYADIVQSAFGPVPTYRFPLRGCSGMGHMIQRLNEAVRTGSESYNGGGA